MFTVIYTLVHPYCLLQTSTSRRAKPNLSSSMPAQRNFHSLLTSANSAKQNTHIYTAPRHSAISPLYLIYTHPLSTRTDSRRVSSTHTTDVRTTNHGSRHAGPNPLPLALPLPLPLRAGVPPRGRGMGPHDALYAQSCALGQQQQQQQQQWRRWGRE